MDRDVTSAKSISTISTREVYRNRWMSVREDEILRSNGQKGIYGVIDKHDGAIILPIEDGRIWLVEQYRYTIEERALELPQGSWDEAIDDPEVLARGELMEELGLGAVKMIYLGFMWNAYGFARQKSHVFIASGLTAQQANPDAEEHDIEMRNIPIAEFEQMMLDGRVRDGCTLAAWGMYQLWRSKGNSF